MASKAFQHNRNHRALRIISLPKRVLVSQATGRVPERIDRLRNLDRNSPIGWRKSFISRTNRHR